MQRMSYNWAPKEEIADGHLLHARQHFRLWAFGSKRSFCDKQVNNSVSNIILGNDRLYKDMKTK